MRQFLETAAALWWRTYGWVRYAGWRKAGPYHATLQVRPGLTSLTLKSGDQIVGVVMLSEFTRTHYGGASATFVDVSHFIDASKIRTDVSFDDLMKIANATAEGGEQGG